MGDNRGTKEQVTRFEPGMVGSTIAQPGSEKPFVRPRPVTYGHWDGKGSRDIGTRNYPIYEPLIRPPDSDCSYPIPYRLHLSELTVHTILLKSTLPRRCGRPTLSSLNPPFWCSFFLDKLSKHNYILMIDQVTLVTLHTEVESICIRGQA